MDVNDLAKLGISGAEEILRLAKKELKEASRRLGEEAAIAFPGTIYSLPLVYGLTGRKVGKIKDLNEILNLCDSLLVKEEAEGGLLNAGLASLMALEVVEGLRYALNRKPEPPCVGFVTDTTFRELSLELADGTIPGIAVIVGSAKADALVEELIKEGQEGGLLFLVAGPIVAQMEKAGVKLGLESRIVPIGLEPSSVIHAINLAIRAPLMFGGVKAGERNEVINYVKERVPVFVAALGAIDSKLLAVIGGAMALGIPVVTDQPEFEIRPMLVSQPSYGRIIETGCAVKKIKLRKLVKPSLPIDYGPAYEGEKIRRTEMFVEFGGGKTPAFELVRVKPLDEVRDGLVEVMGPELSEMEETKAYPLGIIVELAGPKLEGTLEPVLERRIHKFLNQANGLMHLGSRDEIWIRVGKEAAKRALKLKHLGDILCFMFRSSFPRLVEKAQVKILSDLREVNKELREAKRIYEERDARLKGLTEESVDTFYGCTLCQSFAPTHVCVITPERVSLCGATSWLDASMSYRLDPSGPNFPVPKGKCLDEVKGEWSGVNEEVEGRSHGATTKVYLHSMFEHPHTSCGCFQAIAFYIPEVDGIGIVDRSFRGATVNGMAFSTMAGLCGGGRQVEGFLGIGIDYIRSRKFLIADGGLRRVVWMPRQLKERVKEAIPPELYAKIATEEEAKNLGELKTFLKRVGHPVVERWKD